MSTVMHSPEITRAISVSNRVEEIWQEVEAKRGERICNNLQSLVWSCTALAGQWRSLVEFISTSVKCGKSIDYREAGEILRPAADRTLATYSAVEKMVKETACPVRDSGDLTRALIEAGNLSRWLETWPTVDASRRNAARESFARGEICTDSELLG